MQISMSEHKIQMHGIGSIPSIDSTKSTARVRNNSIRRVGAYLLEKGDEFEHMRHQANHTHTI
jgi:hypothetical protein